MTGCSDMFISQYQPIVDGRFEVCRNSAGWDLVVYHRHCTGRGGDCPPTRYDSLVLPELLDVLTAELMGWTLPLSL